MKWLCKMVPYRAWTSHLAPVQSQDVGWCWLSANWASWLTSSSEGRSGSCGGITLGKDSTWLDSVGFSHLSAWFGVPNVLCSFDSVLTCPLNILPGCLALLIFVDWICLGCWTLHVFCTSVCSSMFKQPSILRIWRQNLIKLLPRQFQTGLSQTLRTHSYMAPRHLEIGAFFCSNYSHGPRCLG